MKVEYEDVKPLARSCELSEYEKTVVLTFQCDTPELAARLYQSLADCMRKGMLRLTLVPTRITEEWEP